MRNNAVPKQMGSANITLTLSLLQCLSRATPHQNVFISPISLYLALGLLYFGANGETQQTLARFLGTEQLNKAEAEEALAALFTSIQGIQGKSSLSVANALWTDHKTPFDTHFQQKVRHLLGAEACSLDFTSPSAAKDVNEWTAKATNGKITDFLSSQDLASPVHAVITTASYFYGPWKEPFLVHSTKQGIFSCADGTPRSMPMMSQVKEFVGIEDEQFQAVNLPYTSGRLHCCLFLPGLEVGMEDFLNGLEPSLFADWLTVTFPPKTVPLAW